MLWCPGKPKIIGTRSILSVPSQNAKIHPRASQKLVLDLGSCRPEFRDVAQKDIVHAEARIGLLRAPAESELRLSVRRRIRRKMLHGHDFSLVTATRRGPRGCRKPLLEAQRSPASRCETTSSASRLMSSFLLHATTKSWTKMRILLCVKSENEQREWMTSTRWIVVRYPNRGDESVHAYFYC